MNRTERRRARRESDELSTDELFIPQDLKVNEEWDRNNALFGYRMITRTGWAGRMLGWVLVIGLVLSLISGLYGYLRDLISWLV